MDKQLDLLQGTLDMLVLKAVSLGPLHGYGVLLRIQQISKGTLEIQQGSLYPALYRLEREVGSPANGASRKTSARRSITVLRRRESAGWRRKRKSGTGWRTSSLGFCGHGRRRYEDLEAAARLGGKRFSGARASRASWRRSCGSTSRRTRKI